MGLAKANVKIDIAHKIATMRLKKRKGKKPLREGV